MKTNDLNTLASGLEIASTEAKTMKVASTGGSISIPTIVVSAPALPPSQPSFSFPTSNSWGNPGDDYGGGGGGTGGSGGGTGNGGSTGNSGGNSNINDPSNVLTATKYVLKDRIASSKNSTEKAALQRVQNIIDRMEKSKLKFRIGAMANNGDGYQNGGFNYDPATGEYLMLLEPGTNAVQYFELIAHELTHMEQFMDGDMWMDGNGEVQGYDIWDEVEAYQFQHDIMYGEDSGKFDLGGNPFPDENYRVTPQDVRETFPGLYDDLSNERLTRSSGSPVVSSSTSASRSV